MKSFMWNYPQKVATAEHREPPKHLYTSTFSCAEDEHPSAEMGNSSHEGETLCRFSHLR